jgi:hypothetical protein
MRVIYARSLLFVWVVLLRVWFMIAFALLLMLIATAAGAIVVWALLSLNGDRTALRTIDLAFNQDPWGPLPYVVFGCSSFGLLSGTVLGFWVGHVLQPMVIPRIARLGAGWRS